MSYYNHENRTNHISVSIGDEEEKETYYNPFSKLFSNLFHDDDIQQLGRQFSTRNLPKGIYLHGGVGCGKTFCMNLFYDSLPFPVCEIGVTRNENSTSGATKTTVICKQKVHFHKFMLDIHKQVCTQQTVLIFSLLECSLHVIPGDANFESFADTNFFIEDARGKND